jgi:hypothetical protein
MRWKGPDQFCQQGQIHHGGFIDNHGVNRQRSGSIMAKIRRSGDCAEQSMQCGRLGGKGFLNGFGTIEVLSGRNDRFLQSRRRFSRGSRESDARFLVPACSGAGLHFGHGGSLPVQPAGRRELSTLRRDLLVCQPLYMTTKVLQLSFRA